MSINSTVTLTGKAPAANRLPLSEFGFFMGSLAALAQGSVRMAFQRRSFTPGPRPSWLQPAADVRYVGHEAVRGQTHLLLESPTLGESLGEVYMEPGFWADCPNPEDTALDLLTDVLAAVQSVDRDSEMLDEPMLRSISRFRQCLNGEISAASFTSKRRGSAHVVLDIASTQTASSMVEGFQARRAIRIVGQLGMVRMSTNSFGLKLDDGTIVHGVLPVSETDRAAQLLSREVVVRGYLYYRQSGRPLRIEAESIDRSGEESAMWRSLPTSPGEQLHIERHSQVQGLSGRRGVSRVFGQWPGDETEEEVAAALRQL